MKKLNGTLRLAFTFTLAAFLGGCMNNKPYTPVQRSMPGDTESASLQVMLDQTIDEFGLPGVQVGILRSGQSPLIASSGTVDREHQKAAINEHSSFRVGSTTKMFVAALMCRLAERNVVSLDDTIDRWFPAFPQASTIRVRDLLHQTSGIKESLFSDPWTLIVSMLNPRKLWNPEGIMRTLGKSAKPAQPGARVFSYANDNYVLLGIIAEKAAGAGLASLLEREFFVPLGMEDTALLPWASRLTNGPVPGYDEYIPLGPHLIASDQTSWDSLAFSAGAMSSSAHDLLIWLDSLFHGRVVSEESLKLMRGWGDARNNGRDESMVEYGLGLSRYDLGEAMLEGHPGGGFGGECFPFYDSSSDTSYVVQYNVSRKDNPAGKAILKRLLESEARARTGSRNTDMRHSCAVCILPRMESVEVLSPRFRELIHIDTAVEILFTGTRWGEGPVLFADTQCLVWSDIPGNRMLQWVDGAGVSVFRSPSNYANGNTRDRQGRLITCEHGGLRVTWTEYNGAITVLADSFEGKKLNSPNDVVVKSDGTIWFTDPPYGILSDQEAGRAESELTSCFVFCFDPRTGSL